MGATFRERRGDIFGSGCEVLVNPVNCVGVMGKGLAKVFNERVPGLEGAYRAQVASGELRIGSVTSFGPDVGGVTVISFPTKRHWRSASRIEDVEAGLPPLAALLEDVGHSSVAIPALGCGLGGLRWDDVKPLIVHHLDGLDGLEVVLHPPHDEGGGDR